MQRNLTQFRMLSSPLLNMNTEAWTMLTWAREGHLGSSQKVHSKRTAGEDEKGHDQ